jgi:hypothetical protein
MPAPSQCAGLFQCALLPGVPPYRATFHSHHQIQHLDQTWNSFIHCYRSAWRSGVPVYALAPDYATPSQHNNR